MIVVSDTSVVTSLIQIDKVILLQNLHERVLIPEAVRWELLRTHVEIPAFLEVRAVDDQPTVARLAAELDIGEAEAIVLAKESDASLLLIDDKLGRVTALREGVQIIGLMGLTVEAKRRGLIDSVRKIVRSLETEAGFHVSEAVKNEAFRLANE